MGRLKSVAREIPMAGDRLTNKPPPPSKKGGKSPYNYRWQKLRKSFLQRNPLCIHCKRRGKMELATEVDHKTPHQGNQGLFWDEDNWQALCKSCHSTKTVMEDGGFGRGVRR